MAGMTLNREAMIAKQPTEITPARLSVVVMPNGEVICLGKTIGWFKDLQKYLLPESKS